MNDWQMKSNQPMMRMIWNIIKKNSIPFGVEIVESFFVQQNGKKALSCSEWIGIDEKPENMQSMD